ncbi:MAG TPA: hypothetical protein VFK38_08565 [Candidatus Limnocylindrales bacterium]|nr:hypothetical protein [Candidatus Limnocylindrales bacterium]
MEVPAFVARQFYVTGSLRNRPGGFRLEAHNPLGEGTLVGIGPFSVDGRPIAVESVSALRAGDALPLRATDVTRAAPIHVERGDRVTLFVDGEQLAPGEHELEVRLVELNLGALQFRVRDRLTED